MRSKQPLIDFLEANGFVLLQVAETNKKVDTSIIFIKNSFKDIYFTDTGI